MRKYITVTLNPTVDKMYVIDGEFEAGKQYRTKQKSETVYSGKGINISRALLSYGVESKALCMLRNNNKEAVEKMSEEGLNLFPTFTKGNLRTNISITDSLGKTTEINENGEEVDYNDVLDFLVMYEKTVKDTEGGKNKNFVFISGSTPPGFRGDIYRTMVLNAKKNDAYVILDADGILLKMGLDAKPNMIKPNINELENLTGEKFEGTDEEIREKVLKTCHGIFENTGVEVLCTLDSRGSVFAGKEGDFICEAPKLNIKRFKGAGDNFLARFIVERFEKHRTVNEALKKATEYTSKYLES